MAISIRDLLRRVETLEAEVAELREQLPATPPPVVDVTGFDKEPGSETLPTVPPPAASPKPAARPNVHGGKPSSVRRK